MLGAGGLRARLDSTLGHVGPDTAKQGGGPPLPAFGQQQLAPSLGSALLGILGGEGSEDLITPANAETPAELQAPQPAPTPAPPAPQHCLLCGNLGSPSLCGPLRPAAYEGQPAAVHHLCAIWSPGCFQREVGAGARPRHGTHGHGAETCLTAAAAPASNCPAAPPVPPCRAPRCTSTWRRRRGGRGSAAAPPASRPAPRSCAPTPGELRLWVLRARARLLVLLPGSGQACAAKHHRTVDCADWRAPRRPPPQLPRRVPPALRHHRAQRDAGARHL